MTADFVTPNPGRQALGRPLTRLEEDLATALQNIFGKGIHDFEKVADELNRSDVKRPSGALEPWTLSALHEELRALNQSLDEAYQINGAKQIT